MSTRSRSTSPRCAGFTLIEILIVVVILGILAAIILPQFASAQSTTRAAAMRTQLNTIRGQVSAWRIQNGGAMPGGSGATAASMIQTLIDDGYLVQTVYLSPGFEWNWDPALGELSLSYDAGMDPNIPDADNDGDGDQIDVDIIGRW
ncbi:MAG: prepilin-type N-terminal cleavage/methylation domain-containing protein [Planctomycetota bacterium]|nr:prepilin-type N-terminal cleavage/methylation domain-containing protein [Planctomycetota bacterium]